MCISTWVDGWRPGVHAGCLSLLWSTLFFETVSLSEPGLTGLLHWLARRSGHLPVFSCGPMLELQACASMPSFSMGAGDLNSGPHVCTTNILPTGPSLSLASPLNVCTYMCVVWGVCGVHVYACGVCWCLLLIGCFSPCFLIFPREIEKCLFTVDKYQQWSKNSDFTPA